MKRQSLVVSLLSLAALAAMAGAFFAPIWWVSLTAPNYPQDRFPDGIRIHFGFQGVSNGCTTPPKTSRAAQETLQEDLGWRSEGEVGGGASKSAERSGIDCVHEMNTINHYVGMRPIGVGAPVERRLSPYVMGVFAVMLLGFAIGAHKLRAAVVSAGMAAVSAWLLVDLLARDLVSSWVAEYVQAAGEYFREAERIAAWGQTLRQVTVGVGLGLVVLMVLVSVATWRLPKFQLVLGIVPALLPGYFVTAYAAWLGWFGHTLHPWGAFTLKPFMPTVFGEGLVAQFTTHSYPHWGFGLLCGCFVMLSIAVARRRLELVAPTQTEPATPQPDQVTAAGASRA